MRGLVELLRPVGMDKAAVSLHHVTPPWPALLHRMRSQNPPLLSLFGEMATFNVANVWPADLLATLERKMTQRAGPG